MKKALLLIGVLALALGITYLVLHKNESGQQKSEVRDLPLTIGAQNSSFSRSFSVVLNNYYALAGSLGDLDSAVVNKSARAFHQSIDSIRFDQFKADTAVIQTAFSLAQSIQGDIAGLMGEKTAELKKREFNMITDELYSLIRTVRYDGATIFHMRTTMAFADSSEAYWLSPTRQIINPYIGKNQPEYKDKMLETGELNDSIHFAAPAGE